jgi:hypothetical protein
MPALHLKMPFPQRWKAGDAWLSRAQSTRVFGEQQVKQKFGDKMGACLNIKNLYDYFSNKSYYLRIFS